MGKHFELIKRTKNRDIIGIDMGGTGGKVHMGKATTARITDEALARDIRQELGQDGPRGRGGDFLVAEVPDRSRKITSTGFGPGKWDEIREQKDKK